MKQETTIKKQKLQAFLEEELNKLKSRSLYRRTVNHLRDDPKAINFSSNDYLGLGSKVINASDFYGDADIQKTILDGKLNIFSRGALLYNNFLQGSLFQQESPVIKINTMQYGSTGSRLTTGTHEVHEKLESYIADWKQTEAAIIFSSGYLANLGALSCLLTPRDVVFSDECNHACIFDGIRLSGAKKFIYKHNDIEHLQELLNKHRNAHVKAIIVTDTVFSMDGDRARLKELTQLSKDFNCSIYVDDAHGTGVLGPSGAGLVEELIDRGEIKHSDIDIQMGTFSKAVGLEGAYIAGSKDLIHFLKNKARSFMFSTASSPIIINKVLENLKIIRTDNSLREKLHHNIQFFRSKLDEYGFKAWTNENTAIFAIELGGIKHTIKVSEQLRDQGLLVLPIRPPTTRTPRLRVCISAKHSEEEITRLSQELSKQTVRWHKAFS